MICDYLTKKVICIDCKVSHIMPRTVIKTVKDCMELKPQQNMIYLYRMIHCPHCVLLSKVWKQAIKDANPQKNIVEIERRFLPKLQNGLNDIRSFPTIIAYDRNNRRVLFDEERTVDNIRDFINKYG